MASAFSVLNGTGGAGATPTNGTPSIAMPGQSSSSNTSQFTLTALSRWSILNKPLPPVDSIRHIHVYDFDNTLFKTPLPNPSLWQGHTIGLLSNQDIFVNGGWWHDNRILSATGEGIEKEEPRAWAGWWNDKIVDLVTLSMKQPDAVCILLTGRSEQNYTDLIKRIVASKGLDFDLIGLKPQAGPANQRFQSTMHFKQIFLDAVMETYRAAQELRIYEDRPKHAKGFKEFFAEYNRRQIQQPTRGPLSAEVVQVADVSTRLDPVVEVAEVQHMINYHNHVAPPNHPRGRLQIKKTVYFTSYTIGPEDSQKLVQMAPIPSSVSSNDLIIHGNNILICPRPCPASILEKVGGLGSKMSWQVSGLGCYNNSIWAARLRPIPANAKFHSDNPIPLVVLALKKGAKPIDAGKITNWQSVTPEQAFTFKSTVGEKVILRIESEDPKEDEYESLFANKASKRKHSGEDDRANRNPGPAQVGGRSETRGYHTSNRGGARGRGGQNRGARGANRGGRGRGRRDGFFYRSLDDVEPKPRGSQGDYNDHFPPIGGGQTQQHSGSAQPQTSQRPIGGALASSTQDLQNYY